MVMQITYILTKSKQYEKAFSPRFFLRSNIDHVSTKLCWRYRNN